MSQKTNLNVSPYYDDFDKANNFYRVLFKPGFPVQARELTGLQSILQNQVESFGSHMFKEGSMVIPGGVTCDDQFTTVKVNPDHLGIDITVYLSSIVALNNGRGAKVKGETSGVIGTIKGFLLPPDEGVEEITLFVKYRDGADDGETVEFSDGEVLILEENVSYGNTTLNIGDTVLTTLSVNSTATGFAVGVAEGVYFIRGTFVDVSTTQIVLDPYTNDVSFRVGFDILEEIVNANEDDSLNDNAKGFTNYAAPGADRLKISVKLSKKALTDTEDTSFVELVRVDNGVIKKLQNKSNYNLIRDYFAKRTFDESGNYAVEPFIVDCANTLNNEIGNGGLFREDDLTEDGNKPSNNLMAYKISEGTAYVKGYDIDLVGSTVKDIDKPRDVKKVQGSRVPFGMGSLIRVNNVHGIPYIKIGGTAAGGDTSANVIGLYSDRRNGEDNSGAIDGTGQGIKIGEARVYWFGLTDDRYKNAGTEWDLYLYDTQTYTNLTLANTFSTGDVPNGSLVRGMSSGATGFIADRSSNTLSLSQTSGTFLEGEQVIINDMQKFKSAINTTGIQAFTTEDIKSVFQDSDSLDTNLKKNFLADTVLHPKQLANFAVTDQLTISGGNLGKVQGRFFNAVNGIKVGGIIRYFKDGEIDPSFTRITGVRDHEIDLAATTNITDVCIGAVSNQTSNFELMVPRILNVGQNGLYSILPEQNISSVDFASSELTVSYQITEQSTDANGSLEFTSADVIGANAGISSVFFETFDAERYSVVYNDGSPAPLDSGQVILDENAGKVTITNLEASQSSNVTVLATMKKRGITHKSKDYIRSTQVNVDRSFDGSRFSVGLTTSTYYGTRVQDDEISLNFPDVANVIAVYESTNSAAPILDRLTFATGLALDQNAIVGEKIVGEDSRAIGQVVSATANTIDYVILNTEDYQVGEVVKFKESSISAVIQQVREGSYVNRTPNYRLDTGNRHQFCDYSRIVRRRGTTVPSRKLLIIFNHYRVASGNSGDVFTVNSYTEDRYSSDIPVLPNGLRTTDIIDFRPRVKPWTDVSGYETKSPFDFASRRYESDFQYVVKPDESSFLGYEFYLPRIDLVTINRIGEVEVIRGESAQNPQPPILGDDAMEIAQIKLPAYLYNPISEPEILLRDNRRFTMRDIGKLEDRIENIEDITSLTMLELNAKTTAVTDANGLDRFKSGFIVSDFRDKSLMDPRYSTIDISKEGSLAIAPVDLWSMNAQLALDPGIDPSTTDMTQNLKLMDPNIQKTGDLLTLKYEEVEYLNQPHATNVENVNPFNVIVFVGGVVLDPSSDNWVRTIYINDHRTESTGAKWKQQAKTTVDVDKKTVIEKYKKGGGRGERLKKAVTTTKVTTTTKFKPKLRGPAREFDYVEDVKVSGEADPWMRSRNVYFAANGLRPYTKHYKYLDAQQVDIVPKLCEIEMNSGTFTVFENADIFDIRGRKVGFIRVQRPNHKFGDTTRPDIGAGLGSPAVLVEEYQVDPYDRDRPGPGTAYSPTSKLINFGVRVLSISEKFYGYVRKGFRVVGRTSGAVATITRAELVSDNWGDIIGTFFFRNPNSNPAPAIRVKSGTKTVKVTAVPPGVTPLPGSTVFASEAIGTYSGSGSILTQETSRVSVRNPPKPRRKKTEIDIKKTVKAVHRDPLAQSFTVTEPEGIFLTSVDLFFATKDPGAKIFVELRTVELGTPTGLLVQDYAQVSLNPADINVNEANPFEPVATNVKFESPIYLEGNDTEYAVVILSPASDGYEMWTATMGKKTVRTTSLPDVQNVVVTKQYLGGSLFKSQNGTIWTPSQFQDLTFRLNKAKFVKSGTVTWYNGDVLPKGDNASILEDNPIQGLPRKLKLPVTGINANEIAKLLPGVRVGQGGASVTPATEGTTGFIESTGGPIAATGTGNVAIGNSGSGYKSGSYNSVPLFPISGQGSGAQATITVDASGGVTGVNISAVGTGYRNGEVVGVTSATGGGGSGARVTIKTHNTTFDTLYMTNVLGENYTQGEALVYYTEPDNHLSRTALTAGSNVGTNGSSIYDEKYVGNIMSIKQHNHAHHGGNNKIEIVDIKPDSTKTELSAAFGLTDTTVSIANTSLFGVAEGISTSRGYAIINSEVVSYSNISAGNAGAGTLSIDGRAVNGTVKIAHETGASIQPYEVNGVSLMRINKTHNIPSTFYKNESSDLDSYFIEVDRSTPSSRVSGDALLNFASEKGFGGTEVGISQNYQFSTIVSEFNIITPGKGTSARSFIRTISGTSAGGREVSFQDQGYEPLPLNKPLKFNTPRMVASRANELERLTTLPRNKSLTMRVEFASENENVSPVMDAQNATFILGRNKSNAPVGDYITDSRSNSIDQDPHGAVFVTKSISLAQPATSLKVYIAANVQEGADFRVLYQLYKADSTEIPQKFVPFPGYDNLRDTDGDGFGDMVINSDLNSGRADAFVSPNGTEGFSEYQFTANNLDQFTAFALKVVMSSTNESTPVSLTDFRVIALA